MDVNRCPQSGAEVGWAGGDVAGLRGMSELGDLFNLASCLAKSCEDLSNVRSLLHRNDSQLILFVHPHEECLLVIVENASAFRPVSVEATSLEESVAFFE